MPTDPILLDRLRDILLLRQVEWSEKKMFGGYCFMVDEKMLLGTFREGLMLRVGPSAIDRFVELEGVEQMYNAGRIMKGYAFAHEIAYDQDEQLENMVNACLIFNPQAKSSRKK